MKSKNDLELFFHKVCASVKLVILSSGLIIKLGSRLFIMEVLSYALGFWGIINYINTEWCVNLPSA